MILTRKEEAAAISKSLKKNDVNEASADHNPYC